MSPTIKDNNKIKQLEVHNVLYSIILYYKFILKNITYFRTSVNVSKKSSFYTSNVEVCSIYLYQIPE